MFVLDSSGSLGEYNFRILKQFVVNITSALDIGRNLTQVGAITFNNYPLLRVPIDKYDSKTNLLNAINAIPYYPGKLSQRIDSNRKRSQKSTNADQKSKETVFSIAIRATNDNRKLSF